MILKKIDNFKTFYCIFIITENDKDLKEFYVMDNEFEERVFWILVHIMKKKKWNFVFMDGTPGIFPMMERLRAQL